MSQSGDLLFLFIVLWLLGWMIVLWWKRIDLKAIWLEPVLRYPVLIFESDDWGPGPRIQAQRLHELLQLLQKYQDSRGQHPVMTLGVVLSIADGERIHKKDGKEYHRNLLSNECYQDITNAMMVGETAGVFSLQLHGMEHYWPKALMKASKTDSAIHQWLIDSEDLETERLPSHLQSRWTDASVLPSQAISQEDIYSAVEEECEAFQRIFGKKASVAVPPTFLWTESVEQAWHRQGVEFVVTPGKMNSARDEQGNMIVINERLYNGQYLDSGCYYLVRDDYFEPSMGHTAEQALSSLQKKTELGRPALFETHRFNFIRDNDQAEKAMYELDTFLNKALRWSEALRFVSTEQLGRKMIAGDGELIEDRLGHRIHYFLKRAGELPRLRKLAWLSGAMIIVGIILRITQPKKIAVSV